jgi:hypothetical protein
MWGSVYGLGVGPEAQVHRLAVGDVACGLIFWIHMGIPHLGR